MAYSSVVEMASSQSILSRVSACVAAEGEHNPVVWAQANIWAVVSAPGWQEAWDYAQSTATDEQNPDTGRRPAVISDGMILSSVQAVRAAPAP